MTEITIAKTRSEYKIIARLANTIWNQHYIPIVGKSQVDYMLEKYQSVAAIASQIKNGYEYYLIKFNNDPVGYLSVIKEKESLFLSKIYVLSDYRGRKIGKSAMAFVEAICARLGLKKLTLTVNKNNVNAISAYKRFGFVNKGPIVKDIGGGFVMDDYLMEKRID